MVSPHLYEEDLGPIGKNPFPVVSAEHFALTLAANVDNANLSDADFRAMVRNTLPIVNYPRPKKDNETR